MPTLLYRIPVYQCCQKSWQIVPNMKPLDKITWKMTRIWRCDRNFGVRWKHDCSYILFRPDTRGLVHQQYTTKKTTDSVASKRWLSTHTDTCGDLFHKNILLCSSSISEKMSQVNFFNTPKSPCLQLIIQQVLCEVLQRLMEIIGITPHNPVSSYILWKGSNHCSCCHVFV